MESWWIHWSCYVNLIKQRKYSISPFTSAIYAPNQIKCFKCNFVINSSFTILFSSSTLIFKNHSLGKYHHVYIWSWSAKSSGKSSLALSSGCGKSSAQTFADIVSVFTNLLRKKHTSSQSTWNSIYDIPFFTPARL